MRSVIGPESIVGCWKEIRPKLIRNPDLTQSQREEILADFESGLNKVFDMSLDDYRIMSRSYKQSTNFELRENGYPTILSLAQKYNRSHRTLSELINGQSYKN